MLLTSDVRGVLPIAPTPFFDDGAIDTASIDRLMDFYLSIGATGVTVLGQLGEAPKLEHAESVAIARQVIARFGKLPVVVGVSAPGFAAMRALTREVMDAGAAGVMIAPPNTLAHRRPDRRLLQAGRRCDRRGRALRAAGLPAHVLGADDAGRHPPDRHGAALVRDAQARGLARPGEDLARCAASSATARCATSRSSAATTACSSTTRWSAAPTARTPATPSPTCCATWCAWPRPASAKRRTTCSTRTCPCCATSSSPASGLAVRKYIMMRRGLLTSAAQRKPAAPLTAAARGRGGAPAGAAGAPRSAGEAATPDNRGMSKAPETRFSTLPLNPATLANLERLGYLTMTPIQAASLPRRCWARTSSRRPRPAAARRRLSR